MQPRASKLVGMEALELLIESSESEVDEAEQDAIDLLAAEALGRGRGRPRGPQRSMAEKSAAAAELRAERRIVRLEEERRRPPRPRRDLEVLDWSAELQQERKDGLGGPATTALDQRLELVRRVVETPRPPGRQPERRTAAHERVLHVV